MYTSFQPFETFYGVCRQYIQSKLPVPQWWCHRRWGMDEVPAENMTTEQPESFDFWHCSLPKHRQNHNTLHDA